MQSNKAAISRPRRSHVVVGEVWKPMQEASMRRKPQAPAKFAQETLTQRSCLDIVSRFRMNREPVAAQFGRVRLVCRAGFGRLRYTGKSNSFAGVVHRQ